LEFILLDLRQMNIPGNSEWSYINNIKIINPQWV